VEERVRRAEDQARTNVQRSGLNLWLVSLCDDNLFM